MNPTVVGVKESASRAGAVIAGGASGVVAGASATAAAASSKVTAKGGLGNDLQLFLSI